jgi:integrase
MNEVKEKSKPVRRLSFGKIRKTVSTDVLRISGSELVQQQLLAHTSQSVAGRHYTGAANYDALDDALARYRQELAEAGVLHETSGKMGRASR